VNQYKLQVFEEEYAYVMLIAIVDYGKFACHDLVLAKSAKIAPSKRTRDTPSVMWMGWRSVFCEAAGFLQIPYGRLF
jgi:hypothetical protein